MHKYDTLISLWPIVMAELQRVLLNPAAAQVKTIYLYYHIYILHRICIYIRI